MPTEEKKRLQKPDEQAHLKAVADIELKIKRMSDEMANLNRITQENSKSELSKKTSDLRQKLQELTSKRNSYNDTRKGYLDQLKALQNGIKFKQDESRANRDKIGFKSVAEIDQRINELEDLVSSGSLKLIEEKKAVAEISALTRAKHALSGMQDEKSLVEDDKKKIEKIKSLLDSLDAERNLIRDKLDETKKELDEFNQSKSKSMEEINQVFQKKKELKQAIDAAYSEKKTLFDDFYKAKNEFYEALKEEKARKQQEYVERKKKEQEEKLQKQAEIELENANLPAFAQELSLISTLLKHFEQQYNVAVEQEESTQEKTEKFSIRQVDAIQGTLLKKDDEEYFSATAKKSKSKGKAKPKQVKLDLELVDQLNKLEISIPTTVDHVKECVDRLVEKKKYYLDNQQAKTLENRQKALEKIQALKA